MNICTYNDKVKHAIKKGIMHAIVDEYLDSGHDNFLQFLNSFMTHHNLNIYYYSHMSDADFLEKISDYNNANKMNEALE